MHSFRVWAPLPKKVEVQICGKRAFMFPETNGWWTAGVPEAKTGDDYGFVLDGEGPFPDPRSHFQPKGVHGLSRLVGEKFEWTDHDFQASSLCDALIYELH